MLDAWTSVTTAWWGLSPHTGGAIVALAIGLAVAGLVYVVRWVGSETRNYEGIGDGD